MPPTSINKSPDGVEKTDIYKNANKFVELAGQYMGREHAYGHDVNVLEHEIAQQAKLVQAEIESHPFDNEPAKTLLYLTTTRRKLEGIFEYGNLAKLLSPAEYQAILENGLDSTEGKGIIEEALKTAQSTGNPDLFRELFRLWDPTPRTRQMSVDMQQEGVRVHTDKLLQTVELTLEDLGLEPDVFEPVPYFIWHQPLNYLLEAFYEFKKKGWISKNPLAKGGQIGEAKAILSLFGIKKEDGSLDFPWKTYKTYLATANKGRRTKSDKPLHHLPSEPKFDGIKSPTQ